MEDQEGDEDLTMPNRTCHFCIFPIPDHERGIEAKTKNAWAHFECWYDGTPFLRDPTTGELITPYSR